MGRQGSIQHRHPAWVSSPPRARDREGNGRVGALTPFSMPSGGFVARVAGDQRLREGPLGTDELATVGLEQPRSCARGSKLLAFSSEPGGELLELLNAQDPIRRFHANLRRPQTVNS